MDLMDPYLTTTNQYHRSFKPKELQGYPKKNIATYWECEEYPKTWGHGLKHKWVHWYQLYQYLLACYQMIY